MKKPYNKERGNKKMISYKIDPDVIDMLEELAAMNNRNKANMFEWLVIQEYQKETGIEAK